MGTQPDVLLAGDQGFKGIRIHAEHDGFTIDFSDATLHSNGYPDPKNSTPFIVYPEGHEDIVVRGGTVVRHQDLDTTWGKSYKPGGEFVHSSGLHIYQGDGSLTVEGLRLHNAHDGIVIAGKISDEKYVTFRDVYATHIRDDVIENDGFKQGIVENCLFDGVMVGFSAVNPKGKGTPGNHDATFTVRDTLVRMENMAGDPTLRTTDDGWGHGRLFKWWDGRAPELVLENNIFVLEDQDGWDQTINGKITAKNNILIWMGEGEFKPTLPTGFTLIVGDDSLYWEAHDKWLVDHGYDPDGTFEENLHAPVLDGAGTNPVPEPEPDSGPAPVPEPEPDTAAGLVASWSLDTDLKGNGQKVVIDHKPSLELDDGSIVIDFTANEVSGWQTLLSKDSFGLDDGGGLTIRLHDSQVAVRLESAGATYKLYSAGGAIDAGKAHQVGVSFGDDGFRLYVDGEQVAESDYTGGIAQNKEPLVVGANALKSSDGGADKLYEFFDGTITKVAAYGPSATPQPEPGLEPGPEAGLVASWSLDTDLKGNGQKVVIDHKPSLELDDGSIVIDFTANEVSGWQTLLSKDSFGLDDGGGLTIRLHDSQVAVRLESAGATYKLYSAGGAIDAGKAHQVGVGFGDDGFRLYVDGEQVAESDYTGGIAQNKEPLVVGANAMKSSDGGVDNLYEFFNGTITEVAAYEPSTPQPDPEPEPEPDPEPAADPEVGLVASWSLDTDLKGNGQKVVIDHDPSLELDDGTIVIDFTANEVSGWQTLLSKDSNGYDDGGQFTIRLRDGQVAARLESEDATYKLYSAAGAIAAGKAHQVGVSFSDDGFRLYVDGDQVAHSDYSGGIARNGEALVVGANAMKSSDGGVDNLYEFFNGTIDELAVYDQPFDASAGGFVA